MKRVGMVPPGAKPNQPTPDYRGAVERSIDIIGGRWKAVILFRLMEGTLRFGELHRRVPGVTQQI